MKPIFSVLLFALIPALSISCGSNDPAPDEAVNVQYRVSVSDEYKGIGAFSSANFTVISQDQIKGSWTSDTFKETMKTGRVWITTN